MSETASLLQMSNVSTCSQHTHLQELRRLESIETNVEESSGMNQI